MNKEEKNINNKKAVKISLENNKIMEQVPQEKIINAFKKLQEQKTNE